MTDMNINERTYSFVAHIRNQASVCANAKESQSRPICTRQTYHGLGYTGCGLSASRSTQRNILAWPVLTLCGMATCNGSARVGLLKAKAVDAEKSNPGQPCSQGASCASPHEGGALRVVYRMWHTLCLFDTGLYASGVLDSSAYVQGVDMQLDVT
jgi:hypothetical protein